jgi:hypothetical protein
MGGFAAAVKVTTGKGPRVLAWGHANNDGKPDLFTCSDSAVSVLVNQGSAGNPSFVAPVELPTMGNPVTAFAPVRLRNDQVDIVAASPSKNTVLVYLNNGTPPPSPPRTSTPTGRRTWSSPPPRPAR